MSYLIHNFFRLEIDVLQVKKPPSTIDYSIKYKQTTKTAVDKLNICTQMKAAVWGERAEVCASNESCTQLRKEQNPWWLEPFL